MLDKSFLDAAPRLKAVFFGGGSVRNLVTEEFWERQILLTGAAARQRHPGGGVHPRADHSRLKHAWPQSREVHRTGEYPQYAGTQRDMPGAYQTRVGIVSLGHTGRQVCELLRVLDVKVLAYDPYATEGMAEALGVELVSLKTMFETCEVVSLHAPLLDETRGMITGSLLSR
ncbi:MAG: NAD(P)-dependent oxidoreductase [Verrucomicrobiota bacterium]